VTAYLCEWAWLGGEQAVAEVRIELDGDVIASVIPGSSDPAATRLDGLTVPGFANAHSHAFHRALRGRTQYRGDFWAWRSLMYTVADALDPDSYFALARAVYAEMAVAGITTVGEFHYLHHGAGGARYADRNAMGGALAAAAADVGLRLVLIDACYLSADVDGGELTGAQRRFGDGDAAGWVARMDELRSSAGVELAAAVHSVRAVPARAMVEVAAYAAAHRLPLHLHLSEQPAENAACRAATRRSPTGLAADTGVLGPATTAVHATHVDRADIGLLAGSGTGVCLCPSTERDLGDGIGPAGAFAAAGIRLCLGSDSQAAIDPLAEARAVELDERLATGRRGTHPPARLLEAATIGGLRALGRPAAGLAAGAPADLVTLRLDSTRTAGGDDPLATAVFAAGAGDVVQVVCAGRVIAAGGAHARIGDLPGALTAAIRRVLG